MSATSTAAAPPKPKQAESPAPARELTPWEKMHRLVAVGDSVDWFDGANPNERPHYGVCTAKGMNAIEITLYPPGRPPRFKEGVLHMLDPRAPLDVTTGGWRFNERALAMIEVQSMLPALRKLLP